MTKVRFFGDDISSKGSVKQGYRDGVIGAKEVGMKRMLVIGGDEIEEKGFSVGEFATREERRKESEKGFRGMNERGMCVGLEPFEEGN